MRRIVRYFSRLLTALGALWLLVTIAPVDVWWTKALAGPWNNPTGDVLVVLGGDSVEDVLGISSYWRSVYAIRAWRQGGFRTVVLTGGPSAGASVAERMRDFLVSQGVPASAIQLETNSHSTRENALYSRPILDGLAGSKVLLTSDYHMFRASRVFRKAGIAAAPRPFPDAAKRANGWLDRWPVFLSLCQETVKIGYYFARGWI